MSSPASPAAHVWVYTNISCDKSNLLRFNQKGGERLATMQVERGWQSGGGESQQGRRMEWAMAGRGGVKAWVNSIVALDMRTKRTNDNSQSLTATHKTSQVDCKSKLWCATQLALKNNLLHCVGTCQWPRMGSNRGEAPMDTASCSPSVPCHCRS
jgi:hypothetical protein